jgi:large subunit ribosomal protein L25
MKSVALTAFPRTLSRRGGVKKLRATGRVPAVIYGRQTPAQNLEVSLKEIKEAVHGAASEHVLLDLSVQGDAKAHRLAMVQEIQHHPLTQQVLHLDLHEVAEDEKVTILVPLEATGEAVGVKTGGGTLEHVLFKLKVRALPKDLPEMLTVDVSHLEVGQAIHIGDIQPPAGVEILGDKHISVLSVAAPVTEAQEAAALEAATAPVGEVEMIKEKKEEGAEAPAAKPAAGKGPEKAAAAPAAAKPGEKGAPAKPLEKGPAAKPAEKAAAAPEKKAEKKK